MHRSASAAKDMSLRAATRSVSSAGLDNSIGREPPKKKECPGGGIGRHAVLRGQWRKPCGFKSRSGHHSFYRSS